MRCELLAPAGSVDAFRAALIEGADAVYIGGGRFGARAYADNPGDEELLQAIDQAHILGRRLYLTVNTLLKDRELERELYDWLLPFYRQGLDGVIVQDFGVADFLQKEFPELPLHASTQMTVTGAHGADFLQKNGFCRVVPARELSLEEIRAIYDRTGMEIECFVHGAMCYSYSGQCLMSSLSGGRSGNRGRCAGICRLPFRVYEDGKLLTGRHTQYPLNMKDMCTVEILPELLAAGVCSLKIEGRMKKPEYTAGVVRVYRKYLDQCLEMAGEKTGYHVSNEDRQFLWDLFNRDGFNRGYYQVWNGRDMIALRNEKLDGIRQEAAQRVTEEMRNALASPASALALQAEIDGSLTLKKGQEASLTVWPAHAIYASEDPAGSIYEAETLTGAVYGATNPTEAVREASGDMGIAASGMSATVYGQMPDPARNRPLSEKEVRRRMMKTGGSPFRFRSLTVNMDPDIFVPVGQLNELRREAFSELESRTAGLFRRKAADILPQTEQSAAIRIETAGVTDADEAGTKSTGHCTEPVQEAGDFQYWAEIRTEDQFRQLLQTKRLTGFCLPLHLRHLGDEARQRGFSVRLALPWILRLRHEKMVREAIEEWTGTGGSAYAQSDILARNLEEAALLYEMGLQSRTVLDAGMYTMNTRAERFFSRHGFIRNTVPHELNAKELRARDNSCSEIIAYGRVPVMFSAQCLKKTLDRCTHRYPELVLEDRKGMRFPVLCECDVCMNRILNSVPLDLLGEKELRDIAKCGVRSLRFLFTTECGAEAREIVDTLQVKGSVTRGHFRRGVE